MTDLRYDAVKIRAVMTPEGFLKDSPIIGRSGIQEYRRADGTIRKEYRPPEVIFGANALAMVSGIPVIDKHSALINSKNVKDHVIGSVLGSARQDGDNMVGDIVVYDPTPITVHGRKELSLCYGVNCDETPGTTPDGKPYDAVVTAITRYDHLAIVEKGRAGVARIRLDADDAISVDLPDIEKDATIMADPVTPNAPQAPQGRGLVVIRLDGGLEYQAPPEVERALTMARESLAAANLRADAAEAARDGLQARADGFDAAVAAARTEGAASARVRLQLEAAAKDAGVDVRADSTDRVIREEVIRKVNGDANIKFDGKSDDYVGFAFDNAITEAAKRKKTNADNRMSVNGGNVSNVPGQRADSVIGKGAIASAEQARLIARRRQPGR